MWRIVCTFSVMSTFNEYEGSFISLHAKYNVARNKLSLFHNNNHYGHDTNALFAYNYQYQGYLSSTGYLFDYHESFIVH